MYFYRLTDTPEFVNTLTNQSNHDLEANHDNKLNTITYSTKLNQKYRIVRYNKPSLSKDLIPSYGIFRSVVINSLNNVVCFAPPKSFHADKFMEMYHLENKSEERKHIIAQEFVEGTMINVFFDPAASSWQIATRSTVGANISFFKGSDSKTFNEMFQDACAENGIFIQTLNPMYCYSFVLQHPCNRIVVPFSKPQLYLIEVYNIQHNLDGSICV
jgi:hypothetical protein